MSDREIEIEFECVGLPGTAFDQRTGVRLGIQRGKVVVDDVPGDADAALFCFPLRVRENAKNGRPNFLGPYAQGTPDRRFVYLCWGERRDGEWVGFGRTKIYLAPITWTQVDRAAQEGPPIRARIEVTDDGGRPIFASLAAEQIRWT